MGGCDVVFASDIDPYAEAAHRSMLPDTQFEVGPVDEIHQLPKYEVLLGGYPCQAFSDGGLRRPEEDPRSRLFKEFVRLLAKTSPNYFVVENVPGLARLRDGCMLREQLDALSSAGPLGYHVSCKLLKAEEFGVPQRRRRIVGVGVRRDLGLYYRFPEPTHGAADGMLPLQSGGEAIRDLALWPEGEFYEHPVPEHNFSWYFMSRNRKARWEDPARTVLASWRHVSLHPGSPMMEFVERDADDKNRQIWRFTDRYDHLVEDESRPALDRPRRLSVRECARLQALPDKLALAEDIRVAFRHVGNAVPPPLAEAVIAPLVDASALSEDPPAELFVAAASAMRPRRAGEPARRAA
jgi:DNA (cytosine-5)-methyltransferase 1